MRAPSAAELIRVWELGQGRRPWYRGLLLLAPLFPGSTLRDLSALTLGTRNATLLSLRERLFGPHLDAIVACPACQERVEFSMAVDVLLAAHARADRSAYETRFSCEVDGAEIGYRLLCSDDLEAVAHLEAGDQAVALADRAIVDLPDGVFASDATLDVVADAIFTSDPLADVQMSISCAACSHEWSAPFDVVSFVWNEIDVEVLRLFDDVHRLSAAYGWSEAVILTMSSNRRREYLVRA